MIHYFAMCYISVMEMCLGAAIGLSIGALIDSKGKVTDEVYYGYIAMVLIALAWPFVLWDPNPYNIRVTK